METNRTWKHYQLEERVTRAHTLQRQMSLYLFSGGGFLNVVIIFCFRHLKEFTIPRFTYSLDSCMGHVISRETYRNE